MISINIIKMLEFFDEAPASSRKHATSICAIAGEEMGLALLKHYFESEGNHVDIINNPCTTGKQKGYRLDGWILVIGDTKTLYQVEVKNWSAHAIGGKRLPIKPNVQELASYLIDRWDRKWVDGTFKDDKVGKVLTPMRPPISEYDFHLPLICFWEAIHPKGLMEPLFKIKVRDSSFLEIAVFSMSIYLRNLNNMGKRNLQLDMPITAKRLGWLDILFKRL